MNCTIEQICKKGHLFLWWWVTKKIQCTYSKMELITSRLRETISIAAQELTGKVRYKAENVCQHCISWPIKAKGGLIWYGTIT